mgnify:CR=1 FL=1
MTDEEAIKILETEKGLCCGKKKYEAIDCSISALRDRIARQNPQPLTLKELRKYKHGDPIYLVDTEKPENTGWELWAADLPDGHPDTIAYGKTWFAYRTKPEPTERS